jgi:hypothetical protein
LRAGRSEPDQPARAYLTVIASDPEGVRRALEAKPGETMPELDVVETTAGKLPPRSAAGDEFDTKSTTLRPSRMSSAWRRLSDR